MQAAQVRHVNGEIGSCEERRQTRREEQGEVEAPRRMHKSPRRFVSFLTFYDEYCDAATVLLQRKS